MRQKVALNSKIGSFDDHKKQGLQMNSNKYQNQPRVGEFSFNTNKEKSNKNLIMSQGHAGGNYGNSLTGKQSALNLKMS